MLKGCIAGTKKRVITLRKVSARWRAGEWEPHGLWSGLGVGGWPALSSSLLQEGRVGKAKREGF